MAAWAGGGPFDPTKLLSEFRVVSVMAALYGHEGSLHQLVRDDKGLVFIGVFGLWPVAHADDPVRAVACGMDVRTAMKDMGVRTHVGPPRATGSLVCEITTGLVFCTFVGCAARASFSVFGTTVNKAARLMAKSKGDVWVDPRTYEAAHGRVPMEYVGEYAFKGMDGKAAADAGGGGGGSSEGDLPSASCPLLVVDGAAGSGARRKGKGRGAW
eukprot:tig00000042_g15623.t1